MKKTLVTIVTYVIFLGLGIWLSWLLINQLTPDQRTQLVSSIKSANFIFLIPIIVVGAISHYLRAMRWRYLMEPMGLKPDLNNTFLAVLIGYLTNLLIPRAGEVARCSVLTKYDKMPLHILIGTIVAERAFDLFCLGVITVLTVLVEMQRLGKFVEEKTGMLGQKFMKSGNLLILVAVAGFAGLALFFVFRKRIMQTKIGKLVGELLNGVFSIFFMKRKWEFIGLTVLIWTLYTLQVYITFMCVHGTSQIPATASLVVLVWGSVGLIVTPGGIGAYPYLVAQILGAYPVTEVVAQAFGWISWAIQVLMVIVLGVPASFIIPIYNKRRKVKEPATIEQVA